MATNHAASRASIACFVFFMIAYGISYQPLLPTYPGEVLSTDQRSTGMGLMALTLNLASKYLRWNMPWQEKWLRILVFINLFAIPVALERVSRYFKIKMTSKIANNLRLAGVSLLSDVSVSKGRNTDQMQGYICLSSCGPCSKRLLGTSLP